LAGRKLGYMAGTSIEERLLASAAVKSLQAEQLIAQMLQRLRWQVEHGPFYRDPETGKLREIDVTAWRDGSRLVEDSAESTRVELIIEVKTLKDHHLVFAPRRSDDDLIRVIFGQAADRPNSEWLGHHAPRVAAITDARQMSSGEAADLMSRFKGAVEPQFGAVGVTPPLIPPPDVADRASALRETNIGSDKDVEKSVLWNAILALRSAVSAKRESAIAGQVSDFDAEIEFARSDGDAVVDRAWYELLSSLRHASAFHPVVIVESRMWMSEPGALREIQVCRFFQHSGELSQFWCDVVTFAHARRYMQQVTRHYNRAMRRLGLD
jgi:hypothetical protein